MDGFKSTSWEAGYGDYTMKPDLNTLRRIPWLEGNALIMCDVLDHHTHAEVSHAPRRVLKRQIARLEAMGLTAMMASELDFFLFRESFEQIAAGIAGIESRLPLEGESKGDAYGGEGREIPKTLRDAISAFDQSTMLRSAFGDDMVDPYVHAANSEQFETDRRVTGWELRRGFERA